MDVQESNIYNVVDDAKKNKKFTQNYVGIRIQLVTVSCC